MNKRRLNSFFRLLVLGSVLLAFSSCKKDEEATVVDPDVVTDIDGSVYHTVTIGTQVWMLENLRVTRYRNGDAIPNVTDNTEWANLTNGAYCYFNNNVANDTVYGKLYNGYVVMDSRNIAPEGWHVPSDAEWTTLTDYLGGDSIAGAKLKETGNSHWANPNTGTNESGFTARGGGDRSLNGSFYNFYSLAFFWSTLELSTNTELVYCRLMRKDEYLVERQYSDKKFGYSVRCIKD